MSEYKLPPFVKFYKPETTYFIVRNGNIFYVKGEEHKTFEEFHEAYDYVKRTLEGQPMFNADNIADNKKLFKTSDSVLNSPTKNGNLILYFSYSYQDNITMMENDYKDFLENITPAYEKNPDNILNVWNFLCNHPMFWSRNADHPDMWSTTDGLTEITTSLWESETTGKPTFFLEHGPYEGDTVNGVWYEHVTHTIDYDISGDGETFEEALKMMAKNVYEKYELDGSKK